MAIDKKKYRVVKHGLSDVNGYCRMCETSWHGKSNNKEMINHAKTTGHTVDVFRENWTEYTSWVNKKKLIK